MPKLTDFFSKVAEHNLERFHSECIAWVLNRIKGQDPGNKIFKKFKAGEDFKFEIAVAEVQDHDIVLLYSNGTKFKYVFIENKTKSTLSRKHWVHKDTHRNYKELARRDNKSFKEDFARKFISEGMLQTAYYQLRWLVNKNDSSYKDRLFEESFLNSKDLKERSKIFADPEWVILSQMKKRTFEDLYRGEEGLNFTLNNLGIELEEDNKIKDWDYLTYKCLFAGFDLLEIDKKKDEDAIICNAYIKYVMQLEKEPKEKELESELEELFKLREELSNENIVSTIGIGSANSRESSIDITYNWNKTHDDIKFEIAEKFKNSYEKMLGKKESDPKCHTESIFSLVEDKLDEAKNGLGTRKKLSNKIVCALYKQGSLRFCFKNPNYHNAGYHTDFTKLNYRDFINIEILGSQKEENDRNKLYDKLISFIGLNKEKYTIKKSTPPRTLSAYSFTISKKIAGPITNKEHVEIAVAIRNKLEKK